MNLEKKFNQEIENRLQSDLWDQKMVHYSKNYFKNNSNPILRKLSVFIFPMAVVVIFCFIFLFQFIDSNSLNWENKINFNASLGKFNSLDNIEEYISEDYDLFADESLLVLK